MLERGALQREEQREAEDDAEDLRQGAAEADPRAGYEEDDVVGAGGEDSDGYEQGDGGQVETGGGGGEGGEGGGHRRRGRAAPRAGAAPLEPAPGDDGGERHPHRDVEDPRAAGVG